MSDIIEVDGVKVARISAGAPAWKSAAAWAMWSAAMSAGAMGVAWGSSVDLKRIAAYCGVACMFGAMMRALHRNATNVMRGAQQKSIDAGDGEGAKQYGAIGAGVGCAWILGALGFFMLRWGLVYAAAMGVL